MRTAGDVLRAYRKVNSLTLGELGKIVGCSDTHVSDMEHNKRRPSPEMIETLAILFGANPDYLSLIFGRVPEDLRGELLGPPSVDRLRQRIGGIVDTAAKN